MTCKLENVNYSLTYPTGDENYIKHTGKLFEIPVLASSTSIVKKTSRVVNISRTVGKTILKY